MSSSWFPKWSRTTNNQTIVNIDEHLALPAMAAMGLQHVVAMFGSTVLAPLLMGFDANLAILMSGVGTLLFFLIVGGRVPSYLGSSFAFISVVSVATGYTVGSGPNMNIALALGGIIVCGAIYAVIGFIVHINGTKWIEVLLPPVVTGAIVAIIGLNLAGVAVKSVGNSGFETSMALITIFCICGVSMFTKGFAQRLLILLGLIAAYVLYIGLSEFLLLGAPINWQAIEQAPWLGIPKITSPTFDWQAISIIAPVAIILIAENLGHIKAVSAMTQKNLDPYIGRAFIGDGIATMVSGSVGGTGVTTYAENIGVMAVTRVYSSLIFVVASIFAIILGFSPKFGAVIHTIPTPIIGGISIVVFGLIAVAGARIWVQNQVDFADNRNLLVAAITLILGTGDFTISLGQFQLGGIGTATFAAVLLHLLLHRARSH